METLLALGALGAIVYFVAGDDASPPPKKKRKKKKTTGKKLISIEEPSAPSEHASPENELQASPPTPALLSPISESPVPTDLASPTPDLAS